MAELFSLVKIRGWFKIILMDEQTPLLPASPADQSPAPALDPAHESAQESVRENAQEPADDIFVSPRKLAANRRNSSRSTGPRSASGKRRSAMNALKHGMFAKDLVLPELEGKHAADEFRALLRALTSDLAPAGAFEFVLVEEIAACTWRMRRLLRFENRSAFLTSHEWKAPPSSFQMIGRRMLASASLAAGSGKDEVQPGETHEDECDRILAENGLNDLSLGDPDDVRLIRECENTLMRHIFRSITMLKCLQADRTADPRSISRFRLPRRPEQTRALDRIIQPNQGS